MSRVELYAYLDGKVLINTLTGEVGTSNRCGRKLFQTNVANTLAKYYEDSSDERQENKLDCD